MPLGSGRTVADTYDDLLAISRLAEEVGFDTLWFAEHHFSPDSHLPSPVVLLAAVAAVTERIALAPGIVLAPFQHPLRFAEDCAVLDQLAHGRLIVALGSGWWDEEFAAFGVPMRERAGRTAELAQICRLAWDNERFSYAGRYHQYTEVSITPKPAGRLPLFMGGTAPPAVERAGRLADGYLGTGTPQSGLEAFLACVEGFDDSARAAGRDPNELPIGFHVNAWVSPDGSVPPTVFEAMWNQVGTYLAWHDGRKPIRREDLPPLDEAMLRKRAFLGTPEQIVAGVRPWIEACHGRELHILFRLHSPGMTLAEADPALRLFGEEVIPQLKAIAEPR